MYECFKLLSYSLQVCTKFTNYKITEDFTMGQKDLWDGNKFLYLRDFTSDIF